jgi:ElaB/YqjD/DUF883 family membrane-anchored ribosome-binding protein
MKNAPAAPLSPAELLLELKALTIEAETMMAESLSGHSAEALEGLRERCDAAQQRFGHACAGAQKKVVAGARYADAAIHANPYPSLAVAAACGVLVGGVVGAMIERRNA